MAGLSRTQGSTLNVRLPRDLKRGGDRVLERAGMSISDLVRNLYSYMVREQRPPDCLADVEAQAQAAQRRRRAALESVAGILDGPVSCDDLRLERLQRQLRPGVRP